ncbi:DUF1152 domain-containing protein [Dactylosporangium vinaceum]|uniref:DUF1152 domain-containing protein n=1 Tax=Dactylosporangium vinaceum TaxID=53362 RepID=A0ABV5MMN3_9ACTN|nr:DUF1152 domain-containing protein [Dactylosporangium vinaceum]UAB93208.1 DUF1152 domain-containing protein [Dactylosporangium vinaceum]
MTPSLAEPPLFAALAPARRVLLAGAGGGFDVYAALPLAFALWERGVQVHLASLSFGPLTLVPDDRWLNPDVAAVTPDVARNVSYFPELTLAHWLQEQGRPSTVYALRRTGVQPLRAAYRALVDALDIDAVVLVDGGTDILLRGDESGLGTPVEDIGSLAAVAGLDGPIRLVTCLGFGIDAFHGVNHVQVLENLADLDRDGGYLGALSIPSGSREAALYRDAVAAAQAATPQRPSIVNAQIAAALNGDTALIRRLSGPTLFVNPLMAVYFTVNLLALARRCEYLHQLQDTPTVRHIEAQIEHFRAGVARRAARVFPH